MITHSVLLPLPADAAFRLFTDSISSWWPAERRHTNDPNSELFLQADGRFYERTADGREIDLGKVTAWEPPRRIVLDFYIATDAGHPTEAIIAFEPEAGGTRVTVTHSHKPESKDLWDERAPRYARSWQTVLEALVAAAQR
jgi:uncharacterized protein YndB with AHSA1/START domain